MTEYLLIGWEKIHEMLKDAEGNEVCGLSTLKRKHAARMKELGVVFEEHRGRVKRRTICAWPSMVRQYFTALQQEKVKAEKSLRSLGK